MVGVRHDSGQRGETRIRVRMKSDAETPGNIGPRMNACDALRWSAVAYLVARLGLLPRRGRGSAGKNRSIKVIHQKSVPPAIIEGARPDRPVRRDPHVTKSFLISICFDTHGKIIRSHSPVHLSSAGFHY